MICMVSLHPESPRAILHFGTSRTNSDEVRFLLFEIVWLKISNQDDCKLCRAAVPNSAAPSPPTVTPIFRRFFRQDMSIRSLFGRRCNGLTIQGSFLTALSSGKRGKCEETVEMVRFRLHHHRGLQPWKALQARN
jgi:hypothetical protein